MMVIVPKRNPGKPGRKSGYNPDLHPALAEAWAATGKINTKIAEKLNISEKTLDNWKNKHPEFLKALSKGKMDPDDQVERTLFQNACGYSYSEQHITKNGTLVSLQKFAKPDTTAQIFWLCNRRKERWRHVNRVERSVQSICDPSQITIIETVEHG